MGFIAAKCTQCGANIQVDDSKDAGICSHCKTAFVTEKVINNYSTNVTNNNNYAGATIIAKDELQKLIDAAKGFEKLGDPHNASHIYEKITTEYPQEFIGWWGFCLAQMRIMKEEGKNIFSEEISPEFNNAILDNARKLANKEQINMIDAELIAYTEFMKNLVLKAQEENKKILEKKLQEIKDKIENTYPTFENFIKDLDDNNVDYSGIFFPSFYGTTYELKLDRKKKNIYLSGITKKDEASSSFEDSSESRCIVTGWDNDYTLTLSNNVENYEIMYNKGNWFAKLKGSTDISKSELNKRFTIVDIIENNIILKTSDDKTAKLARIQYSSKGLAGRSYTKGGCYVATCVYGSYDCPQVWTLRRYRDEHLASTWYGRGLILSYYAISPTIVKWFGNTSLFNRIWKARLDKMVINLQEKGINNTPYEDKKWYV